MSHLQAKVSGPGRDASIQVHSSEVNELPQSVPTRYSAYEVPLAGLVVHSQPFWSYRASLRPLFIQLIVIAWCVSVVLGTEDTLGNNTNTPIMAGMGAGV